MIELLLLVVLGVGVASYLLLTIPGWRLRYLSTPFFAFFKRVLPPPSPTEREAMEAGTVCGMGSSSAANRIGRLCIVFPSRSCGRMRRSSSPRWWIRCWPRSMIFPSLTSTGIYRLKFGVIWRITASLR